MLSVAVPAEFTAQTQKWQLSGKRKTPDRMVGGYSHLVAGTGFEPVTSGL